MSQKEPFERLNDLEMFLNVIDYVIFDVSVSAEDFSVSFNYLNRSAQDFFKHFISEETIDKKFNIDDMLISIQQQNIAKQEIEEVKKGKRVTIKKREFLLQNLKKEKLVVDASYFADLINDKIRVRGILCVKSKISEESIPETSLHYYKNEANEFENLKEFFYTFDALIMIINEEGRILFVSPNVGEDILFKPREEVLGRRLSEIFPKGQAEFFMSYHKEVLRKGEYIDFEYHLPIGNKLQWFQCRLIPVHVRDGKYQQVVAIIRDITHWRIKRLDDC